MASVFDGSEFIAFLRYEPGSEGVLDRACMATALHAGLAIAKAQAESPAPPWRGMRFACPDFCHGLLVSADRSWSGLKIPHLKIQFIR